MPGGGSVNLFVREVKTQKKLKTASNPMPAGQYVEIEIRDNGPGVSPPLRDKMFEFLVSTKGDKGSGMGLSIVRRVVDAHNGYIIMNTRHGGEDSGTSFKIFLPVE